MSEICWYCHEDREGYTYAIDKNGHAFIAWEDGKQKLLLRFGKVKRTTDIEYCPMCGRRLNE